MVELLIVEEDGERAAPGEAGQIYFKSKMGSDFEYHHAPEKTKDAHLEPGVPVGPVRLGRVQPEPGRGLAVEERLPALVLPAVHQIPVVEAGSAHGVLVDLKPERADQMEWGLGRPAGARGIGFVRAALSGVECRDADRKDRQF